MFRLSNLFRYAALCAALLVATPVTRADLESQACSNLTTGASDAGGTAGAGNDQARSVHCNSGHLQHNASTQDVIMAVVYGLVAAGCYVACAYNQTLVCTGIFMGTSILDTAVLQRVLDRQNAEAADTIVTVTSTTSSVVGLGTTIAGLASSSSTSTAARVACYATAGLATLTSISKTTTAVINENGSVAEFRQAQGLLSGNSAGLVLTADAPVLDGSHRAGGTTSTALTARNTRTLSPTNTGPEGDKSGANGSQDLAISGCLSKALNSTAPSIPGPGCEAVNAAMASSAWPKGIQKPEFQNFIKEKFGKSPADLASDLYAKRGDGGDMTSSAVASSAASAETKAGISKLAGYHKSLYPDFKGQLDSGYSRPALASTAVPEDPNAQLQDALSGMLGQLQPKKKEAVPVNANELSFQRPAHANRAIASEDRQLGIFDRVHWRYEIALGRNPK